MKICYVSILSKLRKQGCIQNTNSLADVVIHHICISMSYKNNISDSQGSRVGVALFLGLLMQ